MGKIIRSWALAGLVLVFLSGCRVTDMSGQETRELEYTVVKEEDIPEEIRTVIEEKKAQEFQMTYQSENYLYLLKGYGQQMSGGYSIQIEDLSLGDTAIYFKTVLIGPEKGEAAPGEPSYPYIVVKLEYRQEPVQFQ